MPSCSASLGAEVLAAGPLRDSLQGRRVCDQEPPEPAAASEAAASEPAAAEPVVEGIAAELLACARRAAPGSPCRSRSCRRERAARPRREPRRAARSRACSARRSGARRCPARSRRLSASSAALAGAGGGSPEFGPSGSGTSPTGCTPGFISAIASSPFRIADPIAVPRPVVRPSSASSERLAVGRRRHRPARRIPRTRRAPSGCPSAASRRTCAPPPARRPGGSASTSVEHIDPRHVEGQDDRRAGVRDAQRTTCGRAAANARATRRGEQQRHGEMPLPPLPLRQHRAQQRDARIAHRLLPAAAQCPPVHREQERGRRGATAARAATRTTSQITRPSQRIERTEPRASRSPPAAANSAVTSRCFSTRLNSRSIDS